MIQDALMFPFRVIGRYMLVIGGVLSLMISFASFIPLLGYIITIGASGYFTAYSFRIINTTAIGQDQACDWPDFRDFWTDLIAPWLCVLAALLFSFGPSYVVIYLINPQRFVVIALLIVGFTHMPMAFLSVAIHQTPGAAFWTNTIPVIKRCLERYIFLLIILGGLTILYILCIWAISDIPIIGWFLSFFLWMYALMVSARILGLFYRENSSIFNV
ncbi:MAG: hypothetical protein A2Z38_00425 [Planctomycetes bacterium RBG_19FT_COMBO_48_8]|nr:MAG: hypothetical protein A2Z38_00425 [Planctomycetes bacterium RBG_19FT_COMBO_48_8]